MQITTSLPAMHASSASVAAPPAPLYGFGTLESEPGIWLNGSSAVGSADGYATIEQAIDGARATSRGPAPAVVVVASEDRFFLQSVQWEIDDTEGDPAHATMGEYHAGLFSDVGNEWPPRLPKVPSFEAIEFDEPAARVVIDDEVVVTA